MASEEVGTQKEAALAHLGQQAESLTAFKAQLESVDQFRTGLGDYIEGVSAAQEGAAQLGEGLTSLQTGATDLSTGS